MSDLITEVTRLQETITKLHDIVSDINARWRADREELARLKTELKYWMGEKAESLLLDGDRTQYQENSING